MAVRQKNIIKKTGTPKKPRKAKLTKIAPSGPSTINASEAKNRSRGFYIVGIGASAGGLEAFQNFFTHMPSDSGMAFVLVPHLDPTHKSIKRFTPEIGKVLKLIQTDIGRPVRDFSSSLVYQDMVKDAGSKG